MKNKCDTRATKKNAMSAVIEQKKDTAVIKPFKSYFGGKSNDGTFQKIINCIRPHELFIEGFVGGGGVLSNMKKSETTFINDIDKFVVDSWLSINHVNNFAIFNLDIIEFLDEVKNYLYSNKTVLYLDPPYPLSTRKSNHRYNYEIDDNKHLEMLRYVQELNCDVLISTYPNDLYKNELKNYWSIEFESVTRSGKTATEVLYMNYDPGTIELLHDYRYVGENFRERERIKRISKNLNKKFSSMLAKERNAIIQLSNFKEFIQ